MDYHMVLQQLASNQQSFQCLLSDVPQQLIRWKATPEQWCLLEIICHLRDIEKDDFRIRLQLVLEDPTQDPPPIFPETWPQKRAYMEQDFAETTTSFLSEREQSIQWLRKLLASDPAPNWDNTYQHRQLGPLSAHLYFVNWLAHDYLHIRQITKVKYDYLKDASGESLTYAGKWM
ncbi:MAG: DinB family protein [Bacteroidota bacterium]